MANYRKVHYALLMSTLMLTACGGGGGSASSGAPSSPVAISGTNADQVAATGLNNTTGTVALNTFGGSALTGAAGGQPSALKLFTLAKNQIDLAAASSPGSGAGVAAGVAQTVSYNCTGGGTAQININDADSSGTLSAGDSLSVSYSSCVEAGQTANGGVTIVVDTLTGDPTSQAADWSFGITFTANSLTVVTNGVTQSVDGGFSASETYTAATGSDTTDLTGNSLTVSDGNDSASLSNFDISATLAGAADYCYDSNYTVSSAFLGGTITVATQTPFCGTAPGFPGAGVMVITGANKSKVMITALSSTQVEIDVDANGDGVYETKTVKNWTDLISSF